MATAIQVATFIEMMAPIAQRQAKKHGNKIFPSVCIAQACHESGYGTSTKMVKANAVFGIKVGQAAYHFGTAWKGASYNTKTKEYYNGSSSPTVIKDNFRAYDNLEDATEDYFDMLCTASRYKAALNATDYKACIRAIAPSYATGESLDHAYSNAIIYIIEKYNLTKYDGGSIKPITPELIEKIIAGEYGNGKTREAKITAEGYIYSDVRKKINDLDKVGKEILPTIKNKVGDYWKCVLKLMDIGG